MYQKYVILFVWIPFVLCAQNTERDLSVEKWFFNETGKNQIYPASVPGSIHTDLWTNRLIEDPFYADNEKKLQWISEKTWEYTTDFELNNQELDTKHITLKFDGLDTYATVFLNNIKILDADNMFRLWQTEVKNHLKTGKNHLKIIFYPVLEQNQKRSQNFLYRLPEEERTYTRKAQYQYGWDWGPRLLSCGIWKKVSLLFWNDTRVGNVTFEQKILNDSLAKLIFNISVQSEKKQKIGLKINENNYPATLKKGLNQLKIPYQIKNPQLWWTNGLGKQTLYPINIQLKTKTETLLYKPFKIGLRTLELVQENDSIGKSFYFKLNGVPVFMKGANYIPADHFPHRITREKLETLLSNAQKAHFNMLRVWGGGTYPDDSFYEICNEKGLLVWQDFMFACGMYPADSIFLNNVKSEITEQVNRIQNHPCIAIYCGNNEIDEAWHNWGWQKNYQNKEDADVVWNAYETLFKKIIPHTLDSILPPDKNEYWTSSPSIGWGREDSYRIGDSHYWGVWAGQKPLEDYTVKVGRFVSEYGFQGFPTLKTLKTVIPEKAMHLTSDALKNHQKHSLGFVNIQNYMEDNFKIPEKFEDYAFVSQLLQAEGVRLAIEAHRGKMPYCMGSLYWQLNDTWPVISWSSIDYYDHWKALHYQVRRSFNPDLFTVQKNAAQYKIYFITDALQSKSGLLNIELKDFEGKILWQQQQKVVVLPNTSQVIAAIPVEKVEKLKLDSTYLKIRFENDDTSVEKLHFFAKPKELQLSKTKIDYRWLSETELELRAEHLARFVYVENGETFFEDNYFDLEAGIPKKIKASNNKNKELIIKALNNIYP